MAVKANGSKLDWGGYQFGAGLDGEDQGTPCESLEAARELAELTGTSVKIRAVYYSPWADAEPNPGEAW